jgi:hypothetical protein
MGVVCLNIGTTLQMETFASVFWCSKVEIDGVIYACRVCGDPDPGVHHREPGKSLLHLMIALCAGCHAKVHRTKVVLTEFPPLLLVLWREQHPEGHEQTYIDFDVRKPPAQSGPLNFEPARKD